MKIPDSLIQKAFRSNKEYAWRREDVDDVIKALRGLCAAVIGGEIWLVQDKDIYAIIPQKHGPPAVYSWETTRKNKESWISFVSRCAEETMIVIGKWPDPDDLPVDFKGDIYYNLTWVSEVDYEQL